MHQSVQTVSGISRWFHTQCYSEASDAALLFAGEAERLALRRGERERERLAERLRDLQRITNTATVQYVTQE